ncbi:MAG: transglycosylase SLT domain-containing protein [Gammaproteobacteria bacterium]
MRKTIVLVLAGMVTCVPVNAEIYRYVRADGLVEYTDVPKSKRDKPKRYRHVNYNLSRRSETNIYKYVANDGRVYFTDKPTHKGFLFYGRSRPINYAQFLPKMKINRSKYTALIAMTALKHNLDPDLLHAVIRVESAYNPNAVSSAGAMGLMQLMPGTAKRYGVADRSDPLQNIEGGAHYLKDLLAMFNSNLTLAIAAYNAGENAVIKYNNSIPPYPETQQYVKQVLSLYQRS